MLLKTFDFSIKLTDPLQRSVSAKGELYMVEDGRLVRCEGTTRPFSLQEDALDFEEDFSGTLHLSIADLVHGMTEIEAFYCKTSIYDCQGKMLKLYDVFDNGAAKKVFIVFVAHEEATGGPRAGYVVSRTTWNDKRKTIAEDLGVSTDELGRLVKW